jgi:hypothetical protein
MKKVSQTPGQLYACKQVNDRVNTNVSPSDPKSFSQTGSAESLIRGVTYTREEMEHEHRANVPIVPYEVFEQFMIQHGAVLVEEAV